MQNNLRNYAKIFASLHKCRIDRTLFIVILKQYKLLFFSPSPHLQ